MGLAEKVLERQARRAVAHKPYLRAPYLPRRVVLLTGAGDVEAVLWGPQVPRHSEAVYQLARERAAELGRRIAVEWQTSCGKWVRYYVVKA